MGIFDKLMKRPQSSDSAENQALPARSGEGAPALRCVGVKLDRERDLKEYQRFSFAELAAVGVAFAQRIPPLRTIQQQYNVPVDGIYRVLGMGKEGTLAQSGGKNLGILRGSDGKFTGMLRMEKLDNLPVKGQAIMPYDPTALMLAIALAEINRRFDEIEQIGREVLEFLEQDKEAQIRGSLAYLQDVLKNYGHNCDNEMYRKSQHIKVLDIVKDALDKMEFYRGRIEQRRDKRLGLLYGAASVDEQQKALQKELQNFRLSLHVYAFARFLEVFLLENFDSNYIESVAGDIEERARAYDALYAECLARIEGGAKAAVENQLVGGVGGAIRVMGEAIAKIPVVSKSQIDESLISAGDSLRRQTQKNSAKLASRLESVRDSAAQLFIDRLRTVEQLYNAPQDVLFDRDYIYLKRASA